MPSRFPRGRCATFVAVCACAIAGSSSVSAAGSGGGTTYVAVPGVAKVKCIRKCASRKRARAGSVLRITGSDLRGIREVVFLGSYGRSDDVVARVRSHSSTRVNARVPLGAVSGPLRVRVSRAVTSKRTKPIPILPPPPPAPNATLSPVPGLRQAGAPRLETGTSRTKVFYGARRAVVFSWRLSAPGNLKVELVNIRDGAVVMSWAPDSSAAGEVKSIVWTGKLPGRAAPNGRYAFRLTARGTNGAIARSASASDAQRDAFDLYDHRFPVRGRHDYGGGGAEFGAGRGGRSHRGHDVFAACGKKMVAARGGRVQYSGYQGAAGNYIVIDGGGTDVDYAYMHLAEPSPFRKGDRVYTGQRIGSVGETGNAHGCHLHFELWRGGWYEGGEAFDPEPSLRAWDSWS